MATGYWKKYGGAECVTCCPVEEVCDCALYECALNFGRFALNLNRDQYTGNLVGEVIEQNHAFMGFLMYGTYERPVIDGVTTNTFGRYLIQSYIDSWGWTGAEAKTYFTEMYRVLSPYWECYRETCLCDAENAFRVECQALDCVMTTIQEFITTGTNNRAPWTLKEFAEGGICGVCYTDCDGTDYIFNKAA